MYYKGFPMSGEIRAPGYLEEGREILPLVQVNMPYRLLVEKYLPWILKEGINPEIGFDCFALDRYDADDFRKTAETLAEAGRSVTFHAPFYDLRPGALDPRIRRVTRDRLSAVFDLVPAFTPKSVVCHAAFDRRYYISHEDEWLENSIETWEYLADLAHKAGTVIALENTYEDTPELFGRLMDHFRGNPRVMCCFDTGHCNAFSEISFSGWLDRIGADIGQLHLHDNDGSGDGHLPPGEGTFPFTEFFAQLKTIRKQPIVTLEPHREDDFWKSLRNIASFGFLEEWEALRD